MTIRLLEPNIHLFAPPFNFIAKFANLIPQPLELLFCLSLQPIQRITKGSNSTVAFRNILTDFSKVV